MSNIKIAEYEGKYKYGVKALLRELQEYIVNLDPYKFNILKEDYEDKCFKIDYDQVVKNNGIIYIALENDKVIGLIVGIIREAAFEYNYERKHNMGEVIELIVTKNIRCKGIGKKLVDKMELYFKENNCKTVNIDVFGYNDIGRTFYLKNGYHTRMITVSKEIK